MNADRGERRAGAHARADWLSDALQGIDGITLDDGTQEGVRFATMHRVKGLEFDRVVIASVNDGLVPQPRAYAGAGDRAEREKAEIRERALLYVAATRARKEPWILSYGRPSPFLT